MQSILDLGIPLPTSSSVVPYHVKDKVDLFWVALKDKTKTNILQARNLPCEIVNFLLLEAFRLDSHLLTKCR